MTNTKKTPCVLLVEDEPMVLVILAETLRDAGYSVLEANDGITAMGILTNHPEIDLLITDVKMPGITGYQLAEAGIDLRPDLKILLMTGYAQDPVPERISKVGAEILHKPFDIDRMPALANRLLGVQR